MWILPSSGRWGRGKEYMPLLAWGSFNTRASIIDPLVPSIRFFFFFFFSLLLLLLILLLIRNSSTAITWYSGRRSSRNRKLSVMWSRWSRWRRRYHGWRFGQAQGVPVGDGSVLLLYSLPYSVSSRSPNTTRSPFVELNLWHLELQLQLRLQLLFLFSLSLSRAGVSVV